MFKKIKSKKVSSMWWIFIGLFFILTFGQFTYYIFPSMPLFSILLLGFITLVIFTQIKNNRTKKILSIAIKSFIFAMIFGIILPIFSIYISDTVKFSNEIFVFIGIAIIIFIGVILGLVNKKTVFIENIIFVTASILWLHIINPVVQVIIRGDEKILTKLDGLQFVGVAFPTFVVVPIIIILSIVFYLRDKLQSRGIE